LRASDVGAGAVGTARLVPCCCDPTDDGCTLFWHCQSREPDLEPVDVATLVGEIRRLNSPNQTSHPARGTKEHRTGARGALRTAPRGCQEQVGCLKAAPTIWCLPV